MTIPKRTGIFSAVHLSGNERPAKSGEVNPNARRKGGRGRSKPFQQTA